MQHRITWNPQQLKPSTMLHLLNGCFFVCSMSAAVSCQLLVMCYVARVASLLISCLECALGPDLMLLLCPLCFHHSCLLHKPIAPLLLPCTLSPRLSLPTQC